MQTQKEWIWTQHSCRSSLHSLRRPLHWFGFANLFGRRDEPRKPLCQSSSAMERLRLAAGAAERGNWRRAETALDQLPGAVFKDPRCVNLLGLVAELRGDWKGARRMYGRAMRLDCT